ncbi:putative ribonuclease ZC3H12C [Araneus ventricosus]|uniref:Putative ribonuclease ZC3H12C n=1 Tax=Araneus ventricosus TaxID=182803 RepID=A0A4Y2C0L9_ARAVE|nr:putative ribonuclease ZC3H12C [Araneus ventricosus]
MDQMKKTCEPRTTVQSNVTTITLSDSESDSFLMEAQQKSKGKQIESRTRKLPVNKESNVFVDLSSVILIEDSGESVDKDFIFKRYFNSLTAQINGNSSEHSAVADTIVLNDSPPPPDFILLSSGKGNGNAPNGTDDSDIVIEDEIPRPIVNEPKCLRPIVIDGSNVAREHGKASSTFSCRGIKIAVDYFMQRGHTQVIAFVPQYRRNNKSGPILTTDQHLLKELAKGQHVVFTPSRRIDKRIICWDDWFVVEYATITGGIILSNNNYSYMAAESEEFRKTINERLLMFCFVWDVIMLHDPLGRNGSSLENFLLFPI